MARPPMRIRDAQQLDVLASPIRQQIVDAVCGLGRCSVSIIAAALGRPADGLYYHLRKLVYVGLLVEVGQRRTRRRTETLYDAPTRGIMRLVYDPTDAENVERITRIVGGMLRTAERDFAAGFDHEHTRVDGPDRNLNASRQTARLGAAQRRELNRLINRIQEIFADAVRTGDEKGEFVSTTLVMAPLKSNPVRRER